jgi:hypothetical protein
VPNPAGNVVTGASPPEVPAGERININPSDAKNVEKCGHGFVTAIVSGAAIDAFLTYTKTDATALADIKGGLKADIASVFKVSGSFEQRQESVSKQNSTSISMYRFGGNGAQLVYDLTGLKTSLKDIVKDATQSPKPIRIGVLPYRYLDTQPGFTGAWSADTFAEPIDAFFMAKDVFERTEAAIDKIESLVDTKDRAARKVNDPILFLNDVGPYVDMNTKAMRHANRLSTILLLCRNLTNNINNASNDPPPKDGDGVGALRNEAREAAISALGTPSIGVAFNNRAFPASSSSVILSTDEDWDKHLTKLYLRDAAALSSPLPVGSDASTWSEAERERIQYCQTRLDTKTDSWVTDTFLARSVAYALRLQASELSRRPIYWGDLGALRKNKIKGIVGNTSISAPQKLSEIIDVLSTFQQYIRTTGYRREICDFSFTHPVCGTDIQWVDSAALAKDLLPDLAQIKKELGG